MTILLSIYLLFAAFNLAALGYSSGFRLTPLSWLISTVSSLLWPIIIPYLLYINRHELTEKNINKAKEWYEDKRKDK